MDTIIIRLPDGCNRTWVMATLHRVLERQGISPKELRWVEEKTALEEEPKDDRA